jgi:hypothetical protein
MPFLTRGGKKNRDYRPALLESSPLRRADPRVKLAMGLTASLAVMLPLEALVVFVAGYILFLAWAGLLPMVPARPGGCAGSWLSCSPWISSWWAGSWRRW